MVGGDVGGGVDGGQLVLGGGGLVVLGLGHDAELPQLLVQLLHELLHPGLDGAEVVVVQLLALGGPGAEEGAAGVDQVLAPLVDVLVDEEILLLRADGGLDGGTSWLPKSFKTRRPWRLMASMERSSGVFLSSASPP